MVKVSFVSEEQFRAKDSREHHDHDVLHQAILVYKTEK